MAADFTPNLNPYSGQGSFRFWVQKVLPLVYDDSLSYYELLCKVVTFLNNVIQDMDTAEENIELINNAYVELQHYVNTYFDHLDIEAEVDAVLMKWVEDGRLEDALTTTLTDNPSLLTEPVGEAIPGVVSEQLPGVVSEQIGNVVSPLIPGAVSTWLDENVEPTTPVVDESLTISGAAADAKVVGDKFQEVDDLLFEKRIFNGNEITWRYSSNTNSSNGAVVTNENQKSYATTDSYLTLSEGSLHLKYTGPTVDENDVPYVISVCFYTDSGYINRVFLTGGVTVDVPNNATRIRFSFGRATSSNITCTSADTDLFEAVEYLRSFEVDSTLTINGAAADAGVVGDWVRNSPTLITSHCTTIPSGSDFNDYTTPGNYRVVNTSIMSTLLNRPASSPGRLYVLAINSLSQICQIFVPYDAARFAYYTRTKTSSGFGKWNGVLITKYHNPTSEDDTAYIRNALTSMGRCILSSGTYYVSGIDMPDNSELIGEGIATKIVLMDSVETGYAIKMGNNCVIKNVNIIGSEDEITFTEGDIESIHIGNRHGILYLGTATQTDSSANTVRRGTISDCYISGFTGGAITCENTGYGTNSGLNASNVTIENCGAGINISYWSEYNRFVNISATRCYYGCINNGGNNLYSNCGFNSNIVGLYMNGAADKCVKYNGETATTRNGAHGSMTNCTINHTGSNTGYAIYYRSEGSGFSFVGCQIFFGKIYIRLSTYVQFNGCNFGGGIEFYFFNSGCSIMLTNNFFRDNAKAFIEKSTTNSNYVDINDFDDTGNLYDIKYINCYYGMSRPATALTLCQEAGIIS